MDLDEYQTRARAFAKHPTGEWIAYPKGYPEEAVTAPMGLLYAGLGLGEAGEVQGKIKKIMRDANFEITPAVRSAILAEVGDTLWYCADILTELNASMNECAKANLEKLQDRMERDQIGGSGDNR